MEENLVCSNCGNENNSTNLYCTKCGENLKEKKVAQVPDKAEQKPIDLTIKLWTEKDFKTFRGIVTRNEILKSLGGLVLAGIAMAITSGKTFNGLASCWGLFGYALILYGFWLFIGRWIGGHQFSFDQIVLLAQKQSDWFHETECPFCKHNNRVNIGYYEFSCQKCGQQRRNRATLKTIPPDIIQKGAECGNCKEINALSDRPSIFTCEQCGENINLERIPV